MNRFPAIWGMLVVKYRAAILLLTAVLMAISPLSFNRLYHDNSSESYFLKNDPNLTSFNRLLDLFGDNEYLLVGIPAASGDESVFTQNTLAVIYQLSEFLEGHRHVTRVRSLSGYEYTHDEGGTLLTDSLFEDFGESEISDEDLQAAKKIMSKEQIALGSLLTEDFKHTQVMARTTYIANENTHKVEVVSDLVNFIREKGFREQGYDIHLSGIPVIGERFETLTQNDMAWINPVMGVLILIILFSIFRSVFATLMPMCLIAATVTMILGIEGWLRWPLTAVNSALIPTIIILSVGASIHVLIEFYSERRGGLAPAAAAEKTVKQLLFPIFFTCLTTAMGFIALSVTELMPVRQFAQLAAMASMIIFFVSCITLPALLSYTSPIAKGIKHQQETGGFIQKVLHYLSTATYKNRVKIVFFGFLITCFSLYSIKFINVDTNLVNYFKTNSWVNIDLEYFNDTFKGISNLEIIVDTGKVGGIKDPVILKRVEDLQNYLEGLPETGKAFSIIRFYKKISQSLHDNDSHFYELPESSEMAAQYLLMYENSGPEEDLSDLKDFDERFLRIAIPVMNMDSTEMAASFSRIEQYIKKHYSDLSLEMTGAMVMNNAQNIYVNNGMLQSFGVAIIVIGCCFILLFGSIKYGAIALIPSIVPVILTGGLISIAGVAMDLGTMIVGAMTLGIAVDDSIHLMSRYRLNRKHQQTVDQAITNALATSGKAVILTSCILVTGFSVMLLGSFVSYIYVGLFSAMIMIFALIGDLVFMPALLYYFDAENKETPNSAIGVMK